ncbi:hypothetical protein [[Eubacterium] cellulosolvens]
MSTHNKSNPEKITYSGIRWGVGFQGALESHIYSPNGQYWNKTWADVIHVEVPDCFDSGCVDVF